MDRARILTTTDLSENSLNVIDKAIDIAIKSNSWLEVLHVIEPKLFAFGVAGGSSGEGADKQPDDERLKAINGRIKDGLGRKIDMMSVETRFGNVVNTVKVYAIEKRAKLIVIGHSGRESGLKGFFLGSIAKQIVIENLASTLVVKNAKLKSYETIYAPTNFSFDSQKAIGEAIEQFSDAKFVIEHLIETPSELQSTYYGFDKIEVEAHEMAIKAAAVNQMKIFIDDLKAKYPIAADTKIETKITVGEIHGEQIAKNAESYGAQLITLYATPKRSSHAYAILDCANVDLLLVK
ncbi:hypothetical protein FACS189487_04450 [Campylobacterota bacterium]|nr:hypothetical protein FACS189487_04450 [Campylobacterota bacterium]